LVSTPNPKAAANQVYSFVLGALLQAKIQNDLGVLRNLEPTIRSIIGAQRLVPAGRP
jgi:flagellin-specific chaperone FliS